MQSSGIYVLYFLANADPSLQVMKESVKETFENNLHLNQTIETIWQVYLSKCGRFVQEADYHQFIFFCFAPKERAQVILPEKELNELLDDSPNIFKKSNINCHID